MGCTTCGKDTSNPKFCSRSCAAVYNNAKYPKRSKTTVRHEYCIWCGETVKRSGRKYCSCKCQQDFQYHTYINKWLVGADSGTPKCGIGPRDQIRRYLKLKYNNCCCRCGWSEANPTNGIVYIEVEHIDGDCSNNRESNLELICPNCHTLTPTYKYLNTGNSKRDLRIKRTDPM